MSDFPDLSEDQLRAISDRHGLGVERFARLRSTGVINTIYALDEAFVLRVPTSHPAALADTLTESVAAPAAHAAGIRTPRLVVFDASRTIVEVPFTIYERVHGETLSLLQDSADLARAWRGLGKEVARLHASVTSCADPEGYLDKPSRTDPRPDLADLAAHGVLTAAHARWLGQWLDALAPAVLAPVTPRFLHDDLTASNVMVTAGAHDFLAMIDWGDAGWGDPALELRWMPLRAIPIAMEGYRELAVFENDDTVEARVLWDHIVLALDQLKAARKGQSRAGYLWELFRFVLEGPDRRFSRWFPARPAPG